MRKVLIVGGGPAGLSCAITSRRKNHEVILIERNKICGKKILATGNGHSNYFNEDFTINHYHSNDMNILEDIITPINKEKVLSFFSSIDLIPKIKNGYYYPKSNQATTVKELLEKESLRLGVIIKTCEYVEDIEKNEEKFIVKTNESIYIVDNVVLATGSKAYPKTGSDGNGYLLARKLGHTVTDIFPSLVQLHSDEKKLSDWAGVRTDARILLYEDGCFIKEEVGEVQLTNYGISGICTMQLSGIVASGLSKKCEEVIKICFLPGFNNIELDNYFLKKSHLFPSRSIEELLLPLLNSKLVKFLLEKTLVDGRKKYQELNSYQKEKLISYLLSFPLKITGTNSFNEAQTCRGGVSLREVKINTFESKKISGLYIIGELLDVDGECGGYNLGFAFLSGILSGSDMK